ncbi:hypothetical protein GUJ93_ZPchr0008g11878 [Zizania palustris]|uniref:Uncharacterized protein n=1 Tax=Zizania palustris TaxID=103762 RepID=A0A8J5VFI1_ZIZPA|nr:hypothetical protein GUJ93_ZPchr0008g11878 [Zizania palustris]KAG8045724.1 hypothetical protein GUJ93_ZPchr0008g11878 [Zizania palustris]KAG8045725.1 hypothetical protein GUJ93_ZPchr0008g11878 [Zizania palustris]KAG8045726.1 hypothetical protein GUJ93_ZPchr0008g11878 [Zizania palustris]
MPDKGRRRRRRRPFRATSSTKAARKSVSTAPVIAFGPSVYRSKQAIAAEGADVEFALRREGSESRRPAAPASRSSGARTRLCLLQEVLGCEASS